MLKDKEKSLRRENGAKIFEKHFLIVSGTAGAVFVRFEKLPEEANNHPKEAAAVADVSAGCFVWCVGIVGRIGVNGIVRGNSRFNFPPVFYR